MSRLADNLHASQALFPVRDETRSQGVEAAPPVALAGFLVAAVVFVNEASFRNAAPEDFSVDWQVLLRIAVCGGCGLYAL